MPAELAEKAQAKLEKVRDAIRHIAEKLTGAEKRKAKTAEEKLTAALEAGAKAAEALQNIGNAEERMASFSVKDVQNLTERDVRTLLENVCNGEYGNDTYIPIRRNTPALIISVVDEYSGGKTKVENLPIVMQVLKVRQAMDEDVPGNKNRGHEISIDGMVAIIKKMDTPEYIVLQKNGRYVEVVRFYDGSSKSAWAVLDFGEFKREQNLNGYKGGTFNVLVTAFSPDNFEQYLHGSGNTIVYDKKKDASRSGSGSLFPSHSSETPFVDSVAQGDSEIKSQFSLKENSLSDGESYRFYGPSPMSKYGHAMFSDRADMVSHYGNFAYSVSHDDLVDVRSLFPTIEEKLLDDYEAGTLPMDLEEAIDPDDIAGSIKEMTELFDPEYIDDSAGAFDNASWVEWFWDRVAEPLEVGGVKTNDGAVVFDKHLIQSRPDLSDWFHQERDNTTRWGVAKAVRNLQESPDGATMDKNSLKEADKNGRPEEEARTDGGAGGQRSAPGGVGGAYHLSHGGRLDLRGGEPSLSWAQGHTITPAAESVHAQVQAQATAEYGLPCFVVDTSVWKREAPAGSINGEIYVSSAMTEDYGAFVVPHEATHAMKQLGFDPYMEFLQRTELYLDLKTKEGRWFAGQIADHIGVTLSLDLTTESVKASLDLQEYIRLYDEMNATIYGHYAAGDTDFIDYMKRAMPDFGIYIQELSAIHEQFKNRGSDGERYSLKGYWHTDLTKAEMKQVQEFMKRDIARSNNSFTGTSNWFLTRVNGQDVFGIYSTEVPDSPTLLYEAKGARGIMEHTLLTKWMEELENGVFGDRGTEVFASWAEDFRYRQGDGSRNYDSPGHAGESGRADGVDGGARKLGPSRAFVNCVENLLQIEQRKSSGDGVTFSLKEPVEEAAALDYKSSASYKINAKLREGMALTAEEQRFVDSMDRFLSKLPVHRGEVYRRIGFDFGGQDALDEFLSIHQAGAIIPYEAYTSASTALNGYPVKGDLTVLLVIDGLNARDMAGFGNNFESEVIFPRQSRFLVDRVETDADGKPVIYMKEVMQSGNQGVRGQAGHQQADGFGPDTDAGTLPMQRVQEAGTEGSDVPPVPGVDTAQGPGWEGLPGVRGQVTTDSQGRSLSPQQMEFFKDSKAVDEDGRLMVMYHVSDHADIGVFQSGNSAGLIYFAQTERAAKAAARGSEVTYPCYLNVTNPVNTADAPIEWYNAEDSRKVSAWRSDGHDGVYVKDESGVSLAVFSPGQIKGVDNMTPTKDPDIRYSLKEFPDGRRFVDVDVDQAQFDGLTDREKLALARKIIKERFAGKVIGVGNPVYINFSGAREYSHPVKEVRGAELDAKARVSTELDCLMDVGFNFRTAPDGKDGHIHQGVRQFEYFDVIFKVGRSYFQGTVNVQDNARGRLFKDITKIRDITDSTYGSYGENPQAVSVDHVSGKIVSQPAGGVNGNFSLKGSEDLSTDREALLRQQVEGLQERLAYWMKQTKRTTTPTIDSKAVRQFAKELTHGYKGISYSDIEGDLLYVLASAFQGGNAVVPVKMEIKEFWTKKMPSTL